MDTATGFQHATVRVFTLVFALLIGLDGVASGSGSGLQEVDLYAVIVGISKYANPKYDLRYAAKDAQDFFEFLKERRNLFRRVNVALRLNDRATRASIAEAVRVKLQPARKEDIAIIYLAGHGCVHPKMKDEFYFLPYDMDKRNLFGTALLMNDPHLYRGIRSERLLLLADSCRSGGFLEGLGGSEAKQASASFSVFGDLQGRFGISASAPDEIAMETPIFGNGLFTFFILKGLRGAAEANGDGVITVQALQTISDMPMKQGISDYLRERIPVSLPCRSSLTLSRGIPGERPMEARIRNSIALVAGRKRPPFSLRPFLPSR